MMQEPTLNAMRTPVETETMEVQGVRLNGNVTYNYIRSTKSGLPLIGLDIPAVTIRLQVSQKGHYVAPVEAVCEMHSLDLVVPNEHRWLRIQNLWVVAPIVTGFTGGAGA